MEIIQETSEIFVIADINGGISQFVYYGLFVAIDSTWL